MHEIAIFRSTGRAGSVVLATLLTTLYGPEIPDDLDDIIDDLEGDFCNITNVDEEEHDCEF
jgi:hypothetical protein